MPSITFAAPYTYETIDALKLAALYFEQVELHDHKFIEVEWHNDEQRCPIVWPGNVVKIPSTGNIDRQRSGSDANTVMGEGLQGRVKRGVPLLDDEFLAHIQPFIEQGIMNVVSGDRRPVMGSATETAEMLLRERPDLIYEQGDLPEGLSDKPVPIAGRFQNNEALDIHSRFFGPLVLGCPIYMSFVFEYYTVLLGDMIDAMSHGKSCLSSSPILASCLEHTYSKGAAAINKNSQQYNKSILDLLRVNVPDVSSLSIEDILEVREATRDELLSFRHELDVLSQQVSSVEGNDELLQCGEAMVKNVQKAVTDLESKMRASNLNSLAKLIQRLRNPKAYAPLLATLAVDIPAHLTILLSLGLICLETSLEHEAQKQDIFRNGLFYMIKLRRLTGSD